MNPTSETIKEIDESKEKEDLKKIEAVFFVSGRFLSMPELISLTDLNPIIIEELIEKLQEKYDKQDSAIEIIKTPSGVPRDISEEMSTKGKNKMWKMDIRLQYHDIINKLAGGKSEFTKAEQETLAIIAFKQPIKQSVIIKIRGNKAYDHIKKFFELDLIKKKKISHTHELSLSDDFYNYFNIDNSDAGLQESLKEKTTEE